MESSYSPCDGIEYGVPQWSTLGQLLFNIFICHLSLILDKTYFAPYIEDNTLYTVQEDTSEVVNSLEEISKSLIEWFKDNEMKLNPDKCHLVLSDSDIKTINVGNFTIKFTFDNKSNF